MKMPFKIKYIAVAAVFAVTLSSCESRDKRSDKELSERAKVGKVYDPDQQGPTQENWKNQFPSSRNTDKPAGAAAQATSGTNDSAAVKAGSNKPAKDSVK